MKARTATRLGIGGLVLLALLLSIGAQIEGRKASPPSPVPSIDNPGPQGLEAAYLYLLAQHRAAVLDASPSDLPAEARVIVTALPYAQEAGPEERALVWKWVEQGGTLVVLGDHSSTLGGLVPGDLTPTDVALSIQGREVGLSELGSDIQSLISAATKAQRVVSVPGVPLVPDPLLVDVGQLSVSGERGFRAAPGEQVPLVAGGDTPVVEAVTRGKGTVYLFAGPDVLANARIDRADNLRLLANLAARGTVYFDEYHHRLGASDSVAHLARALAVPFAQLLFFGLMLVWSLGRRVGPLRPAVPEPARTTHDYAQQVGDLYRRAHAEAGLSQDLELELREWLERRLAAGPGSPLEHLQEQLSRREPALGQRAAALFARLRAMQASNPSPEQFAEASRAVVELARRR